MKQKQKGGFGALRDSVVSHSQLRFWSGETNAVLLKYFEPAVMVSPKDYANSDESYYKGYKRRKMSTGERLSASNKQRKNGIDDSSESDPFSVPSDPETWDPSGKYRCHFKDIKEFIYRQHKLRMQGPQLTQLPNPQDCHNVIDVEDDCTAASDAASKSLSFIVISDDEEEGDTRPSSPYRQVPLMQPAVGQLPMKDTVDVIEGNSHGAQTDQDREACDHSFVFKDGLPPLCTICGIIGRGVETIIEPQFKKVKGYRKSTVQIEEKAKKPQMEEKANLAGYTDEEDKGEKASLAGDKGVYVGVREDESDDDDQTNTEENGGLGDIWQEMSMALELSKAVEDNAPDAHMEEDKEECDHSFILKDDLGYVCRICGIVDKGIESIIEVQFHKAKRSNRTYMYESRNAKGRESGDRTGVKLSENDLMVTEVTAHPRHRKVMKPHQVEGFNFLSSNLVTEKPGGCILAHAPGSGKTFMIISFVQSFLAKYPHARPLVVLPKGILGTWKKEFQIWQVEDIPLLDFYSVKADNRAQQLEVLKKWVEQKSILFLGYQQFSAIVCDHETNKTSATCQEILLKQPSILILDEGHAPRNEDTDMFQSLAKVQTPLKVVLSGTLYQNHVKEVFNILNLVRPNFVNLDTSRAVRKRIMSKVRIRSGRKVGGDRDVEAFYESVEDTLLKDEDFNIKVTVIKDLREMTSKVLHYYKGDFLDELPGLVDFTVVLNLSSKQKTETQKLKHVGRKFKVSSVGSAIHLHPVLNISLENTNQIDDKMDAIIERMDIKDGVKAKFFLNMLSLCESVGEKLLVFSQYLLPLKFLERLAAKRKGWSVGKEMFGISGDSSSEQREWSMERFNNSVHAKIFFGSIKACGEGISLVGASRIIILDVHLNPSVTRQAIGRAFRPGQKKKVYTYRLVAADTFEEEDHSTCLKKELISRMWFEWNEYCGYQNFDLETVDINDCEDFFLESKHLREDVRTLYKR